MGWMGWDGWQGVAWCVAWRGVACRGVRGAGGGEGRRLIIERGRRLLASVK